jgi:hypothetical protein
MVDRARRPSPTQCWERGGRKRDAEQQEFMLLSGVLGVTMLVDAVNHRRSSGATENSVQGHFYRAERPEFACTSTLPTPMKSSRIPSDESAGYAA